MNKAQEIQILQEAIAKLGPDSYLGPWLAQVIGSVEHDIRSDYYPTITLKDSAERSRCMITAATSKAQEILSAAQTRSADLDRKAAQHYNGIVSVIRKSLYALEN